MARLKLVPILLIAGCAGVGNQREQTAVFLAPSSSINSDHPAIVAKARELTRHCHTDVARTRALYEFVRDSYTLDTCESFLASDVLDCGGNSCRQRSILLAALARAIGIPARLRLQRIVIEDWTTDEGTTRDIVFAHGITDLYVDRQWLLYEPVGNRDKWQLWTQDPERADEMPLPFVAGKDCVLQGDDRIHIETLPEAFADRSPEMITLIETIDDYL